MMQTRNFTKLCSPLKRICTPHPAHTRLWRNSYQTFVTQKKVKESRTLIKIAVCGSIGIIGGNLAYGYWLYRNRPEGKTNIEKQFYEFASVEEGEEWYMNLEDFCNACGIKNWEILEVEPEELKETTKDYKSIILKIQKIWDRRNTSLQFTEEESKKDLRVIMDLFASFDKDNDGRLSLSDYSRFVDMILSPDGDIQQLFRLSVRNENDKISFEEFREGLQERMPEIFEEHSEIINETSPLMKDFFGNEKEKSIPFSEFKLMMKKIEAQTIRSDFERLEAKEEEVQVTKIGEDLSKQEEMGILPSHVIENINSLSEMKEGGSSPKKLSFEEYNELRSFLKHIREIERFIHDYKSKNFTKEEFKQAIKEHRKFNLSEKEVDWVFQIFANPETGKLDAYSFHKVSNNLRSDIPPPEKMNLYQSMLLGGLSATVGASTVFPIDKIKTRMQSSHNGAGMISTARDILKKEGPLRLYRGIQAQLVGITPEKALKLTVNDYLRKLFMKRHQNENEPDQIVELSVGEEMLAGMGTGLVQVFVSNPIEIVKIRLQMQTTNIQGPIAVIRELGFRGLYTGMAATVLRDVPFNILYFSTYQGMKKFFYHQEQKKSGDDETPINLSAGQLLVSSCVAGSFAAGLDTPADGIKTRLQNGTGEYKGIVDCFTKVYASEGIKGLFRGCVARIMIISPLFGITMMCYELLQQLLFPRTTIDEENDAMGRSRIREMNLQLQLHYGLRGSSVSS